tara:strand:+ start:99 stop:668 length:570 start_codon:yes stop_codon:yes gene_type:complete
MPDIDIDFANRDNILSQITHRIAKLESGKKHNTGIYVNQIPYNPVDNISTIDHKLADSRGYYKLDFLNVSMYNGIINEEHLQQLIRKEPIWQLLEHNEFSDKVFHLNGHGELLRQLKPASVIQLAATLAIIRPAKRHLATAQWSHIMEHVWTKPINNEYFFKKSHAISYAVAVVVHMNLLCEQLAKTTT